MATSTTTPDLRPGTRVQVSGYSYGEATFLHYGDPRHACSDDHLVSPGMRIAYVDFDRYGKSPVWEDKIAVVA